MLFAMESEVDKVSGNFLFGGRWVGNGNCESLPALRILANC